MRYTYISIWECEFDKEIKQNKSMKEYVDSIEIITPLELRDAFYGRRTESFKLYHESTNTLSIQYYDATSLYSYINKSGKAVLGHPNIITENIDSLANYEGLMPAKCNGKLLFPLCRTCAEISQKSIL